MSVDITARFTARARKVLELSLREALQLGHNYISTEHLLLALIRENEGVAAQALTGLGLELTQVRQAVIQLLAAPADPLAEIQKQLDALQAQLTQLRESRAS